MDHPISKYREQLATSIVLSLFCLLVSVNGLSAQDKDSPDHSAVIGEGESRLSGTIFEDDNKNAKLDQGEAPAQGVEVSLLGKGSKVIATVISGKSGSYEFTGLEAGVYVLRFAFTPDFVVRSTGIAVGAGTVVSFSVPVITPNSRYNFVRLRLVNPATVRSSAPVSPFQP